MKAFWNWLKGLFTSGKVTTLIGRIVKIVADARSGSETSILNDKQISDKAIEIVEDLNKTDLSGTEKAATFNERMKVYLTELGKVAGVALLNLIRELAVYAVKAAIIAALAEENKKKEEK